MLRLVHLEHSRSERILWLLEELGLPYEVEAFARGPDLFGPPELRKEHRLGRAPVLVDGAVTLAESGAIVEYVLALYGQGRLSAAPGTPDFPRYLYWLHYAEGSLMLQLLREWSLDRMLERPDETPGMARIREGTRLHLSMIDDALSDGPYLAGAEFSAADIMMAYPLTTFRKHVRPIDLDLYPSIRAYVDLLEARPAYQRALIYGSTSNRAVGFNGWKSPR